MSEYLHILCASVMLSFVVFMWMAFLDIFFLKLRDWVVPLFGFVLITLIVVIGTLAVLDLAYK